MRRLALATVLAAVAGLVVPAFGHAPVQASPAEEYSGGFFGADNFPPGCTRDMDAANPDNVCYHMRTGLNALDSPQIDVLVLLPVSPTAERDMRLMRQSIEMWEGGIDYLAAEMGLDWLEAGTDFHITVDYVDLEGGAGSELTTYPLFDPELVVIATNPAGGAGIGIDPVDFLDAGGFTFLGEDGVPCHSMSNPFDFEAWEAVPGFDDHHGDRTGTYTEDCGGGGGNVCFAVNGAVDPEPTTIESFNLFDLVSHEVGHCLTLGHVGDGGEAVIGAGWGPVPGTDIMSYSTEPYRQTKCVSTLDVEGFAVRMSRYLDVNGDGLVQADDELLANDQIGEGANAFQVQHPSDHLYASATGSPADCPQPDMGVVPGERTDWTPEPVPSTTPILEVTSPTDGSTTGEHGTVHVTGTVERRSLFEPSTPPPPTVSYTDAADDATSPVTEILGLDVELTGGHVHADLRLAQLWPSTDVVSPVSYTLVIDGKSLTSLIRYPVDANPVTWDGAAYVEGGSTWDTETNTVRFQIDREYLRRAGIRSPYRVSAAANFGTLLSTMPDDLAPDGGEELEVAAEQTPPPVTEPEPLEPTADADQDGVTNADDTCPIHPGIGDDGCTPVPATQVRVLVDGALAATQDVYASHGVDQFDLLITLPAGTHQLRVEWVNGSKVLAARELTVTRPTSEPTGPDTDGDGHPDAKERARGSDPTDPNSVPTKKR